MNLGEFFQKMTKSQIKHLWHLASIAYERELGVALDRLFGNFQQWKNNEIDLWELNGQIHQYHNGTAREIFNRYEYPTNDILVARAVAIGIISQEQVPEERRVLIESCLDVFNNKDDRANRKL